MTITTGKAFLATSSSNISVIKNVAEEDMPTIRELYRVWREKYPRNILRSAYYDARERFHNLRIAIPPQIANQAQATVGWAEKSVRALADKSVFEGFLIPDNDTHGIAEMVADNQLETDVTQAITSAYKHSCSFIAVYTDKKTGKTTFMPRSADWSSAIWDRKNRHIAAALTVTADDNDGNITAFTVWLPYKNYECVKTLKGWEATEDKTNLPYPMIVPLVYDPQIDRPFGHSRISRVLMNLTDMAFRTMVRMESTAEFYSFPQLWFLGLDEDAVTTDSWKIAVNSINSVSRDEDGMVPTMQQVSQASMSPHGDMLETIVMQVAAATDLTPETMGMQLSNPSSAEALAASESWLTRTANRQNLQFGRQLKNAVLMAVQAREKLETPPDDLRSLTSMWAPTREVSDAARADYYTKIASVNTSFADSTVGLRKAGLSMDEIRQLRAEQQSQRVQSYVDQLNAQLTTSGANNNGIENSDTQPTAQ